MTRPERVDSLRARLTRAGCVEPDAAESRLRAAGLLDAGAELLLDDLARAADPDHAVGALGRLLDALPPAGADGLRALLAEESEEPARRRLVAVLGGSAALGDHLVRHPLDLAVLASSRAQARLTRQGMERVLVDAVVQSTGRAAYDDLRRGYRRLLLDLAARDLADGLAVDDVAGELADLASATLVAAYTTSVRDLAPATLGSEGADAGAAPDAGARLAVIGMGKCGGRELNYVSDVDVVFVAEPADAAPAATNLAMALMRACADVTAEGAIWPVDAALRPEGKSGPLVRTLASHEAYYRRWAKTWEFQALLKARPVAGDEALGEAYCQTIAPMVWTAAAREGFVADVQAMRRRVLDQLPAAQAEREVKLGPGGLRDIEFAVQLLQLVHGRTDETLRSPTTLLALDALAAGGYVARDDARQLADAYRFLRSEEHRLQLWQLRRTHLLPADEPGLRRLARGLGFRDVASWQAEHSRQTAGVRRLHEKLFYRPLLAAVAKLPMTDLALPADAAGADHGSGDEAAAAMSTAQAAARLEALGFDDPAGALRHLAALTSGVSRRAAIQRTLLPVMLGWFADAADPDAGLLAFRQVSDALGRTPWYLRALRDEGTTAERLARVLASSRYVADLVVRAPEGVMLLGEPDLAPRPAVDVHRELLATARRQDGWEAAVAAVRGLRRRELVRIGAADVLASLAAEPVPLSTVGRALSDLAAATLDAALATAQSKVSAERREPLGVTVAVIGMGRLGGGEQGYGSDADVVFVYAPKAGVEDGPGCTQQAHDIAQELRRLLALPAPDPPLVVDADLRPEGRQGPLVRSLSSYDEYYRRWSSVWEAQALLRAAPVAGDAELGERFLAIADRVRYPAAGLDDHAIREIRRVKARVEAERLPRGVDPGLHMKLGRGGLSDVEWVAQLTQLRHAHAVPALRTTATLAALDAAAAADLLDAGDRDVLVGAWTLVSRVRNAVVLARGRGADTVPSDPRGLAAIARLLGYPAGQAQDLIEDYRRLTRRARAVYERVFFA